MQRLRYWLAVCLVVALAGCATLNVGDRAPSSPPALTGFVVDAPSEVYPCEIADFSVTLTSTKPTTATILWEFGGDLTTTTQLGPFHVTVDGSYTDEQSV